MMLIVWPDTQSASHRREDRERNVQDHDERAAPVAQKQQHHQAGEHGAESAFDEQTPDGARHVGRLVELVTDLDVVRQHGLEASASWL